MFSQPVENMADLIANSTTFQTWTGSANATEARTKISIWAKDGETDLPTCAISLAPQFSFSKSSSGTHDNYTTLNAVTALFLGSIPDTSPEDDFYTFSNIVGGIVEDVLNLSGRPGYASIENGSPDGPPMRSDPRQGELDAYASWAISFVLRGWQ
jgi:hypothetical protein